FSRLGELERKSLSEFSLGSLGVLVPPEVSNQILSCLVDPGDLTGIVGAMTIGGASVPFLTDSVDSEELFDWACSGPWAPNGSGADIAAGLGQIEIKAEEIRGVVCASRNLLDDAAINLENWLVQKAADGVRRVTSRAIAVGTGMGMPQGILNARSGI